MGSIIQPISRNSATGYEQAVADAATQETITRNFAAYFEDDFIGPGHSSIPSNGSPATGYPWVKRIVGTAPPTAAIVANSSGGIVALALAATSEKEEASLYANDQLNWDGSKSAQFECRMAMSVLPSAAQVEAVVGLRSAWIDGPDNFSEYVDFQMLGNGAVNARVLDGVTSAQSVSTGVTLVAGVFHNFRIDMTDPTNIQFYIDGVKVSPTPPASFLTFAQTGASAILQPYFSVYKASGTGVGTMQVDMMQVGMNRS